MSDRYFAWFNCASGIAGDMMLGSLIDAGASLTAITETLSGLELSGWSLGVESVHRSGIAATRAVVRVDDDGTSRDYATIKTLLAHADLPDRVATRSLAAFHALALVEASIHGVPLDAVHFHEVGGHDAIIDIVGTMTALDLLGVDDVAVSPIALGSGTIATSHGTLPNPAPATIALLEGFAVVGTDITMELATPTGAAIISTLARPLVTMPPMTVVGQGFGAGSRDLDDRANVVGVVLGRHSVLQPELVALLETTVDDLTGEQLAQALSALLRHGALDAWAERITMKKGRSGSILSVLAQPSDLDRLRDEIMRATGSLGIRSVLLERTILDREIYEVSVQGHHVRIKASSVRAKPEFDDVVRVADLTGNTVFDVEAMAMTEYREGRLL